MFNKSLRYQSVRPLIILSVCLYICLSACLSICLSVRLSMYPSSLSVCLSDVLCIYLSCSSPYHSWQYKIKLSSRGRGSLPDSLSCSQWAMRNPGLCRHGNLTEIYTGASRRWASRFLEIVCRRERHSLVQEWDTGTLTSDGRRSWCPPAQCCF
jgi:hypothetical protein